MSSEQLMTESREIWN